VDGEALTLVPVVTIVLVLAVIDKKQKMITSKITEVRHDFFTRGHRGVDTGRGTRSRCCSRESSR
jgi:hypothetical protein